MVVSGKINHEIVGVQADDPQRQPVRGSFYPQKPRCLVEWLQNFWSNCEGKKARSSPLKDALEMQIMLAACSCHRRPEGRCCRRGHRRRTHHPSTKAAADESFSIPTAPSPPPSDGTYRLSEMVAVVRWTLTDLTGRGGDDQDPVVAAGVSGECVSGEAAACLFPTAFRCLRDVSPKPPGRWQSTRTGAAYPRR